jgi:hypothetical protein
MIDSYKIACKLEKKDVHSRHLGEDMTNVQLEELRKPRARECAYQLDKLLLAAICAVISGAESRTTVVE